MSFRPAGPAMVAAALIAGACGPAVRTQPSTSKTPMQPLVDQYAPVRLQADLSHLAPNDREMVRLLIEAVKPMDDIFWREAWGRKADALALAHGDAATERYVEINVGPWDRLHDNEPFIDGVGPKPAGARFYPTDMTKAEFETAAAADTALDSPYTLVRRDSSGALVAVPYHVAFKAENDSAALKLRQAADLSSDPAFVKYLHLRATALETDDYRPSDMAWLDMKDNPVDVVIGPIETYEDGLFGYKADHEGYVLIKDTAWSRRLQRFARLLPALQEGLPVPEAYKREEPGTDSDLNAYDVVYYAGSANAGGKTIAINLPNDEEVQLAKGTRRLQLENAMRAKFDRIMVPIADALIAPDQRSHVTFDAFFQNTMFHEVAHGLGIKNTIDGRGTVRSALEEHASAMEEGKADVLGVYMVEKLFQDGELTEGSVEDNYVTFLAGIFRSVRFGAADAHGKANMVRFNYFQEHGAFTRDDATGTYRVDYDGMRQAVDSLSALILTLQGDGNYAAVDSLMKEKGVVPPQLQADLARVDALGIPRDIVFQQGESVLFGS
jgi:hypothetical protein